jgi:hypothetical protein
LTPEASPAATSAMATAARFSADAGSPPGKRAKSAQRAAIFRRVASSNSRIILLDYNTSAIDEMTGNRKIPHHYLSKNHGIDLT